MFQGHKLRARESNPGHPGSKPGNRANTVPPAMVETLTTPVAATSMLFVVVWPGFCTRDCSLDQPSISGHTLVLLARCVSDTYPGRSYYVAAALYLAHLT